MTSPEDITLVRGAIHNPNEPRHFMRIVPAAGERTASIGDAAIARSSDALVVKEAGLDLYDHVVYFPRADVDMAALIRIDKATHCPLKGDTEYFDVVVDGERVAEAAWSYLDTIEVAADLRDLVAFDTSKVTVADG